jgi:hypothetical protein
MLILYLFIMFSAFLYNLCFFMCENIESQIYNMFCEFSALQTNVMEAKHLFKNVLNAVMITQ